MNGILSNYGFSSQESSVKGKKRRKCNDSINQNADNNIIDSPISNNNNLVVNNNGNFHRLSRGNLSNFDNSSLILPTFPNDEVLSLKFNESCNNMIIELKKNEKSIASGIVKYFAECLKNEILDKYDLIGDTSKSVIEFTKEFLTAKINKKAIKSRLVIVLNWKEEDRIRLYNVSY